MVRALRAVPERLVAGLLLAAAAATAPAEAAPRTGQLVFTSNRGGNYDVFVMAADGSSPVKLTHHPAADYSPTWSPDGTRVAFVSERDGNAEIYVMAADGSDVRRITSHPAREAFPDWFPGGTRLVFSSERDGNREIYAVNLDGSGLERLTNHPAQDSRPAVSADGSSIAFDSDRDGNLEIVAMGAHGANPVALTHTAAPTQSVSAAWSPSGELAFVRSGGGTSHLATMHADGSGVNPIVSGPALLDNPVWSPDGQALAFDQQSTNGTQVHTVAADGSGDVDVSQTPGAFNGESDWKETAACRARVTEGWFEPTQAVWQDDPIAANAFPDLAGKRLRFTGAQGGGLRYEAELPLVRDRPTLLAGIDHAVGGPAPHDRRHIVLAGMTNCTTPVQVAMEFDLTFGSDFRVLWRSGPLADPVELEGPPAAKEKPFRVTLDASAGIPPASKGSFVLSGSPAALTYAIRDELVRADAAPGAGYTGLFVQVSGPVITTRGPRTLIAPAFLSAVSATERDQSVAKAAALAKQTAALADDWYPIPIGGLPVAAAKDGLSYPAATDQKWDEWIKGLYPKPGTIGADQAIARLEGLYGGAADMAGLERVALLLRDVDFIPLLGEIGAAVFTSKIALVRDPHAKVVLHELAHTLPPTWTDAGMVEECKRASYHNSEERVAHGFAVRTRTFHDNASSPMSKTGGVDWMDQCTYWHLTKALRNPPFDPPVLLVQGRLARRGQTTIGRLGPAYQFDGVADLAAASTGGGSYAIVLRSAAGSVLARYPFTPQWTFHGDPGSAKGTRNLQAFSYRVAAVPGTAKVELVGPAAVLDRRVASAHAPTIAIQGPAAGALVVPTDDKVTVSWTAADADGGALVYSVLYSADRGATWLPRAVDQTAASFAVRLGSGNKIHRVRVIASDGFWSQSATVTFRTP